MTDPKELLANNILLTHQAVVLPMRIEDLDKSLRIEGDFLFF